VLEKLRSPACQLWLGRALVAWTRKISENAEHDVR
jgi:hypothetical protein